MVDLGSELANLQAVLSRLAGPKVLLTDRQPRGAGEGRGSIPSEIEQIVINLVVNACDAMEGEGQIDVTLAEGQAGPWTSPSGADPGRGAVLTIADNGPGMPPDVLARCLEPFFTTKRRGQGSGLGMSTVYGLVNERGGHMDIDSDPTGTADPDLAAPVRGCAGRRSGRRRGLAAGTDHRRPHPARRGRARPASHGRSSAWPASAWTWW